MTPTDEAAVYNSATTEKPVLETLGSTLPVSGIGMQARKKALRERRALGPGEVARLKANADAAKKRRGDEDEHRASEAQAEQDRIAKSDTGTVASPDGDAAATEELLS